MIKRLTLLALLPLFALAAVAGQGFARADDYIFGFSYAKPPYVFAKLPRDTKELRGIELDIVREALAIKGHTFTPKFVSYNRLPEELASKTIDAAATVRPERNDVFYSKEFVYFQNFAITRPDGTNPLKSVHDLAGKRVVAWQGATKDLGESYANATKNFELYREIANQQKQVLLFLKGQVNVIVIDGPIFKHWAKAHGHKPSSFIYHPIFGDKTTFVVGFTSKQLRDDFDDGLAELKKTGEYDRIFNSYISD